MLSKFNCNTLGWITVPSFLYDIQLTLVPSNRSPVCLYVLEQDA